MKKLYGLMILLSTGGVTNAQNSQDVVQSDTDTTTVSTKIETIEEKVKKQELEMQALKKDNVEIKKQIHQIRTSLPNAQRKFSVSRRGSKQVVIE